MSRCRLLTLASLLMVSAIATPSAGDQVNLLSIQEGTFPVVEPASYGGWPVVALLDDSPETGWACPEGKIADNVFVFEMAAEATIERFEFDAKAVDEDGAGAKDVVVEVSTTSKSDGFTPVLQATLAAGRDRQSFDAAKPVAGALGAADHPHQPRQRRAGPSCSAFGATAQRPATCRAPRGHLRHVRDRLQRLPRSPAGHGAGRLLRVRLRHPRRRRSRAGS